MRNAENLGGTAGATLTPERVFRLLLEWTGPSPARAMAVYHAAVTGQAIPEEFSGDSTAVYGKLADAGKIERMPDDDPAAPKSRLIRVRW